MKKFLLVAVLAAACFMEFNPDGEYQYLSHTVQTGETVWEIAEQYAPAQTKTFNEFVFEIQEKNQLAGKYIHPGDKLVIPMWVRAKK